MKPLVLLIVAAVIALAAGTVDYEASSPVPDPCRPENSISVPGQDYLFESRYIYGKIKDEGLTGRCWLIDGGDIEQESLNRFCEMIWWADPTAHCQAGPAPLGAAVLIRQLYLPVILSVH